MGVDAFLIEPHLLEVTRHSIVSNKLNSPLRIAILADLQTDDIGEYERQRISSRWPNEKPDLFLLPGDYIPDVYAARVGETSRQI